jgi:hypothetical protein
VKSISHLEGLRSFHISFQSRWEPLLQSLPTNMWRWINGDHLQQRSSGKYLELLFNTWNQGYPSCTFLLARVLEAFYNKHEDITTWGLSLYKSMRRFKCFSWLTFTLKENITLVAHAITRLTQTYQTTKFTRVLMRYPEATL